MNRRPGGSGRKKNVSGKTNVYKRGSAQSYGGKPVGKADGYSQRPRAGRFDIDSEYDENGERGLLGSLLGTSAGSSSSSTSLLGSLVSLSGIISLLKKNKTARIIAIILVVLLVWYMFFGGSQYCASSGCSSLLSGVADSSSGVSLSSGESDANDSVSNLARDKRTVVMGGGADEFTIMVYMCGTDLESKYGMGTSDLKEMIAADIGDNVNLIVCTGGTKKWNNSNVSNSTNQYWQVTDNGLVLLSEVGKKAMTDPATLTEFINYCKSSYAANRYGLIMWDHGGGSVSGYGYDELYPGGSMTLDKFDTALSNAGCAFDFIGFDACLMATLETALVSERYADYLIASEETEPGVGWYYTNWLTDLSADPSMSTVELGKRIIDDFVEVCYKASPNDKTTLSIIDLAELSGTVPESFNSFARSTGELIESDNYQQVSSARRSTKEFSSGINQVDLVHLAENIGTAEAKEFAAVLRSCVKYNRTSRNIANANGISIYFPYGSTSSVSSAVNTMEKIGVDGEYTECIKDFANVTAGGQIISGGGADLLGSLLGSSSSSGSTLVDLIGMLGGSSQTSTSGSNVDLIGTALEMFLGSSNSASSTGIDVGQLASWFSSDRVMQSQSYYETHYLDPDRIIVSDKNGENVLKLTDEEWDLVQNVMLNVFYDDGAGYIDLGLDNVYQFDSDGDLLLDYDNTWLTINGHIISYYMISQDISGDNYVITGRSPILLNGELMDLIIVFSSENPDGVVAGARVHYSGQTDTVAKGLVELQPGDTVDFLCDYYGYNGEYTTSYFLGEQMIVGDELVVRNSDIGDSTCKVSYVLTDLYGNELWTPSITY